MALLRCQHARGGALALGHAGNPFHHRRPVWCARRHVTAASLAAPPAPSHRGLNLELDLTSQEILRKAERGLHQPDQITEEAVRGLEAELDEGASISALRRFDHALRHLPEDAWEARLRRVMVELAYNLESFNPAFTAVLLQVQRTIGRSDYVRRDLALKHLIQPLAGEYGMHNGQPQAKTHRELFSEFYADLLREPLEAALAATPAQPLSEKLFSQMMSDIMGSHRPGTALEHASYALGYNLAIEYLADYEKTWMLDAFRALNRRVLAPRGRGLTEWLFLEVHAEGEKEHAALGHAAVTGFVPASHEALLRTAMLNHDRDFAVFYNGLADMLL